MTARPNRREEQRARTRQVLAEAALAAFLERGIDAVTVEEIAREAGVSPRTFFLHFGSKAAAIFPDHDTNIAWFRTGLAALPRDGDVVRDLCDLVVEGVRRQSESSFRQRRRRLVVTSPAVRDLDARTDRDYEEAAAEHLLDRWSGDATARLDARVLANVVIGVARAALDAWGHDGTDPVTATRSTLDRLLLPPLGTPTRLAVAG
ncbi:MAG: TetR family transcriptional regulator [Actinobacteria bacterium]|nr:TetR family transcriptional regulator [Actinomycetota bacterium]